MEVKIKIFLGREHFQWSGGDANQLVFIFIWPNSVSNTWGISGLGDADVSNSSIH